MRTRVLSDLHLGHSASRVTSVQMLAPLLEGCDCLVLAGDTWEGRMIGERFERSRKMSEELVDMVRASGVSLVTLRGNHDPQEKQGVEWLADGAVLVTHGDAIYDDATPWSREMETHREEINQVMMKYADQTDSAEACSERAFEIASLIKARPLPKLPPPLNFFVTAFWPLSRSFEMFRVWRGMGEESLAFLKRTGRGARVMVNGHFHRPGVWEKDGHLVINTGAFMRGCRPWMVDLNQGSKLTIREISLVDGSFQPGKVQDRWLLSEQEARGYEACRVRVPEEKNRDLSLNAP